MLERGWSVDWVSSHHIFSSVFLKYLRYVIYGILLGFEFPLIWFISLCCIFGHWLVLKTTLNSDNIVIIDTNPEFIIQTLYFYLFLNNCYMLFYFSVISNDNDASGIHNNFVDLFGVEYPLFLCNFHIF
jgi:hypothetical protein